MSIVSDRGYRWTLALISIQLSLTLLLCVFIAVWWFGHEKRQDTEIRDQRRIDRNLLWEVDRHGKILLREGLAKPGDQLGLPEEIPIPADPTLGETP